MASKSILLCPASFTQRNHLKTHSHCCVFQSCFLFVNSVPLRDGSSVLSSYTLLERLGHVPNSGYMLKVELEESAGGWAATCYRKSRVTGRSRPLPLHWEGAIARR